MAENALDLDQLPILAPPTRRARHVGILARPLRPVPRVRPVAFPLQLTLLLGVELGPHLRGVGQLTIGGLRPSTRAPAAVGPVEVAAGLVRRRVPAFVERSLVALRGTPQHLDDRTPIRGLEDLT